VKPIVDGLTFDDVLLVPRHSKIRSRSEVDLTTNIGSIELELPIISANMKTVTGSEMARAMKNCGGFGILHRFWSDYKKENAKIIFDQCTYSTTPAHIGVSVGLDDNDFWEEYVARYGDVTDQNGFFPRVICVDVAHADNEHCLNWVSQLRERIDQLKAKPVLMVGNVSTGDGAWNVYNAGADCIKVGQGSGSLCSTRIETGNGVPQLTALMEVKDRIDNKISIISDGGIRTAGDIVKALCFADAVMVGNLLAGTDCAPGDVITIHGRQYKTYVGSSTHKTNHVEGVRGLVPVDIPTAEKLRILSEGIKSGLSYQGVKNLKDLQKVAQFVRISNSGLVESKPHDVFGV